MCRVQPTRCPEPRVHRRVRLEPIWRSRPVVKHGVPDIASLILTAAADNTGAHYLVDHQQTAASTTKLLPRLDMSFEDIPTDGVVVMPRPSKFTFMPRATSWNTTPHQFCPSQDDEDNDNCTTDEWSTPIPQSVSMDSTMSPPDSPRAWRDAMYLDSGAKHTPIPEDLLLPMLQ